MITIPSHILKQYLSSVLNGEIVSFVVRELTVVGNGVRYSGRRYWLALDVSMMTVEPRSALDLVRHSQLTTNLTSVSRPTKLDYKIFKKFFYKNLFRIRFIIHHLQSHHSLCVLGFSRSTYTCGTCAGTYTTYTNNLLPPSAVVTDSLTLQRSGSRHHRTTALPTTVVGSAVITVVGM